MKGGYVTPKWWHFRPWKRHSLVLMIGGLIYIGLGVSLFTIEELSPRQEMSLVIALRMFSTTQWGSIFMSAGTLACLSARWPAISDSWGYSVLTGLACAWSAIYILGYLIGNALPSNITSSLVWALIAFMWWAISGLVNPERRRKARHGSN